MVDITFYRNTIRRHTSLTLIFTGNPGLASCPLTIYQEVLTRGITGLFPSWFQPAETYWASPRQGITPCCIVSPTPVLKDCLQ